MPEAHRKVQLIDSFAFRFVTSFILRLINAFTTATFFQPDEYFQSWEVAYDDIYGVGFRSWEWHAGIRTSLMPRFFALLIKTANVLNINHLTLGKLVMAALAAVSDVYSSLVAEQFIRSRDTKLRISRTTWVLSLCSMFNWYCSTRPFSNTMEMVLVVVALYYWNTKSTAHLVFSQFLAHIAIALRPSVAIFWIVLGLFKIIETRRWSQRLALVLLSSVVAVCAQYVIIRLDNQYYNGKSIPYYEFVKYNFGARISEIYGTHPWHWYISQGLPFILLGYVAFLGYGWSATPWKVKAILLTNVMAFSAISHKEFRFLYYLLPLLHIVAALGYLRSPLPIKALSFTVNIIVGLYFSLFHQRGVVDVVNKIKDTPDITSVSFLMPCHSTPWQAYFQRPHDADFKPQFLTCEPPWNISSVGYVDEADQFYTAPYRFLRTHPEKLDDSIVIFEPLEALLTEMGYETTDRFHNGLFNEDWRRKGDVVLMRKKSAH